MRNCALSRWADTVPTVNENPGGNTMGSSVSSSRGNNSEAVPRLGIRATFETIKLGASTGEHALRLVLCPQDTTDNVLNIVLNIR